MSNYNSYDEASDRVYEDYQSDTSFFSARTRNQNIERRTADLNITNNMPVVRSVYSIPFTSVIKSVGAAEKNLSSNLKLIENDLLSQIYINSNLSNKLEASHYKFWEELNKIKEFDPEMYTLDTEENKPTKNPPNYISFREFSAAQKLRSSSANSLIEEYLSSISNTTFSHLFYFREIILMCQHELACIKKSLIYDFEGGYVNEAQQKIALQFDAFAKKVLLFTKRINEEIRSRQESIPTSEMDNFNSSEAAKFQAFFAVRVDASENELSNVISSLKRIMVDNCKIFYDRYLTPSLKMTKEISDPMSLKIDTTAIRSKSPTLAKEMVVASAAVGGNFVSIQADYLDRMNSISDKFEAAMLLISDKRKYVNYINNLSTKGAPRKKVLKVVSNDPYANYFATIPIDPDRNIEVRSTHARLDDLGNDDHPQYLLKDGGEIVGDILAKDGVRVDGVDISHHVHNGLDGSARIKSTDIDYGYVKYDYAASEDAVPVPLDFFIEKFVEDLSSTGQPVVDVIMGIEMDDDEDIDKYEYELVYTEVD